MKKHMNKHLTDRAGWYAGWLIPVVMVLLFMGNIGCGGARAGGKIQMKPEHEDFLKFARYLFTKQERSIFDKLPSNEARDEFIRYFWEIRDPNPYTEENEFRIEMEKRFDYVERYLKEGPVPGWKTDRGRIYILLGEPSSRYEDNFPDSEEIKARVIWYYDESDIYVEFIDTKGNGIYSMYLPTVSLNLLNELENRKYYIVDKEKGKFHVENLEFDFKYDSQTKEVKLEILTKNLSFESEKESTEVITKIKIDVLCYDKDMELTKHTEIKTIRIEKELLLKGSSRLPVTFPLELPAGKVNLDLMVTDLLGEAVHRGFFELDIKY